MWGPSAHLCLGLASRLAPPPARPGGGVVKMNKKIKIYKSRARTPLTPDPAPTSPPNVI